MNKFQTIQKLAEETGIDPTTIRNLLRDGTLTRHKMNGLERIFIDVEEFNSKIQKETQDDDLLDYDMDQFLVS